MRNKRRWILGLNTQIAARQRHGPFYSSRSRHACLFSNTRLGRPEYHLVLVASNDIFFTRADKIGILNLLGLCAVYTSSLVVDTNKKARHAFTTSRRNIFNKITRSVLNTSQYHSIISFSSFE